MKKEVNANRTFLRNNKLVTFPLSKRGIPMVKLPASYSSDRREVIDILRTYKKGVEDGNDGNT